MRNVVLEKEIQVAEGKIIEGHSLSQELKRSEYFPQLVARMLSSWRRVRNKCRHAESHCRYV